VDRSEQPDDQDHQESDQRGEDEQREVYAREGHEGGRLAPTGFDPARDPEPPPVLEEESLMRTFPAFEPQAGIDLEPD
jgi:hypothetical protein